MAATTASAVAPGSGHLLLGRHRAGGAILGGFVLLLLGAVTVALTTNREDLLQNILSTRSLIVVAVACLVAAVAWMATIVHTWQLAAPAGLDAGRRVLGITVVVALCAAVATPLGVAANLANSSRNLLDAVFTGGGTSTEEAIAQARLNILLVGSDAGPDRTGARTDTMMVASLDTVTGRTTLFGLPRNIGFAQFPPNSAMGREFPRGFNDPDDATSGNFLLNAVYAYAQEHPDLAPPGPTDDAGLNLLHETVAFMLDLELDYYVEVNMAGFASLIDALGGLSIDVGPTPIPIGGISPSGRAVEPDGYIPAGPQNLSGEQALAFARSRTDTTDYARMGRQRCLIQTILAQKSPTDLLANFQAISTVATANVSTNMPQGLVGPLAKLAGRPAGLALESVSFDPELPDPEEPDGRFDPGHPNFPYMREVVRNSIAPPAVAPPTELDDAPATAQPDNERGSDDEEPESGSDRESEPDAAAPAPTSLAATCD